MFLRLNPATGDVRLSVGLLEALGRPDAVTLAKTPAGRIEAAAALVGDVGALPIRGGMVNLGGARVRELGLKLGRVPVVVAGARRRRASAPDTAG